ncbi:putative glycerol-3-phosphate transporter 1 [Miscanthus floridulus]|uniref:putative glycerol-3-phosphate transporter 1 n=1 Tax=Miscanthus floridulus TaxID=154761 RepID=UPI003457A74A
MHRAKPPGIHLFECAQGSPLSLRSCQALVLILTFFSYASYRAARKTMSVVKGVLYPKTSNNYVVLYGGWAPFDSRDGTALLGDIDLAFLAIYAIGMFFVGHIGDRVDLRVLLTIGMIGTGFFTAAFGAGYWLNVHSFYYFLGIQLIAGLFQSTGLPSVVAVVGNWFGKRKRGLIMGIWNAHTSVGNISGSLIAAALLKFGWGCWSFVIPGAIIALVGLIMFLFLPASPESIGAEDDNFKDSGKNEIGTPLLEGHTEVAEKAVGFIEAFRIPGVVPFALCLFFCKLVAYTFLCLSVFVFHFLVTKIICWWRTDSTAVVLSTLFDLGGVIGGILAGHISDRLDARALTAASFTFSGIPALFLYGVFGSISLYWNITLMFITGMLVNGPYALITTAVSAYLGTHSSLRGNSRALATVTAIIDGTGSAGTAIGPLLTGYISAKSWTAVFTMLMVAALIAGLLLSTLVMAEVSAKLESWWSAAAPNDLPVSSEGGA